MAQKALTLNREDLAREALHRKVAAQKRVEQLTAQLSDLVELELNLQRNRAFTERRLGLEGEG